MSAILPPLAGARVVPPDGRVDVRQLKALLQMLTAQMTRRGVDASSGLKGHPLLQAIYSMTFLGLLAANGAFQPVSLDTFLARTFGSALVMVALMITAESDDVRMRRAEILLTKPISGATHLAAVAALLALTAAVIAGTFALLPLAAAVWRLGLSALMVPVLLVTLVAGAIGLVLVWVLVLRLGVQRLGADRIRMATQVAIVLTIGLLTWSSLSSLGGLTGGPPAVPAWVLEALPSTWLARFWTDGWGREANLRRAGLLAMFGLAVLAFVRYSQRASADAVFETTTRPRQLRGPLVARALLAAGRVPVLRALVPEPVAALAGCILTLGRREEAARMRGLVTTLLGVGVALWGFLGEAGLFPMAILSSVIVSVALEGLVVTRQSASAPAAWAIAKAPLGPRAIVQAILWAVLARFVAVPLALFAALLYRQHGALLATLLALASYLAVRLVVVGSLAVHPSYPLDLAPSVTGALATLVSWAVGTAGAVAYVVVATVVSLSGMLGTVLAAVGVVGLVGAAALAEWIAARRIARLEHAG